MLHGNVVAPPLRGPERPVHQPRDQVFWNTALLDIELNNFLLPTIGVHEVYYNASGDTTCSSGYPQLYTKQQNQDSAVKTGHQVVESEDLQIR